MQHKLVWNYDAYEWILNVYNSENPEDNLSVHFDDLKPTLRQGYLLGYLNGKQSCAFEYSEEDIEIFLSHD